MALQYHRITTESRSEARIVGRHPPQLKWVPLRACQLGAGGNHLLTALENNKDAAGEFVSFCKIDGPIGRERVGGILEEEERAASPQEKGEGRRVTGIPQKTK